ncbi:hypothetical protein ElyMa_002986400 [Elysia marginata]|uniref:Uncharacterized protein n=1 Tax=Elysia marginata TaxID=1093978 RepID=A0AAV4ICX4_9GAST|nr:hypothetical protein ElyMa_002986400 [Elysia marginata]
MNQEVLLFSFCAQEWQTLNFGAPWLLPLSLTYGVTPDRVKGNSRRHPRSQNTSQFTASTTTYARLLHPTVSWTNNLTSPPEHSARKQP